MEKVYEELSEALVEIEKLKAELKSKADLCESLKRSHSVQVDKLREVKLKIEKMGEELNQKEGENIEAKQMYEDLRSSLVEKESIIKLLRNANDKLQADCGEKFKKWEGEKRGLVLELEEINVKADKQEKQIKAFREEIKSLRGCLSASEKKCFEVEEKANSTRELRERDDMFQQLVEEKRKVEDQLKWKKEQFQHLEEAYEKLRDQFRSSKKEWELEKSGLVDEICSLQMKLDSEVRISTDLRHQLHMCNQDLAHEESQRKFLEAQVSNLKAECENASTECQDTKLQLDCLTFERDKDIADLRQSLRTKEVYHKEMEYISRKLEQENEELRKCLKELQESQIHEAGSSSSLSKLRNKLRSLEHIHRECTSNLRAKEAELSSQMEKLTGDLNVYRSELEAKTATIEELKEELESCHSLTRQLKFRNVGMSAMLLVLNLGISEIQSELAKVQDQIDIQNKEREEKISQMITELKMKDDALVRAQRDISEERDKLAALVKKVESLDCVEERQRVLQIELDRYKAMLEESTSCKLLLEKKVLQIESNMEEKLIEVSDSLDRASLELAEKISEGNEIEFELQMWKTMAEWLKKDLEENHVMRKELEKSLLAQVDVEETLKQEKDDLMDMLEEKYRRIENLQQEIMLLEQELKVREVQASSCSGGKATKMSFESDEVRFLRITREKDNMLEELQKEVSCLEQESLARELESAVMAQSKMEKAFEHEKQNLVQLLDRKSLKIEEMMQQVKLLEQQFDRSLVSFSEELSKKQAEVNLIHEAWDKITAAETLAALEIEEKKLMVLELEDDIHDMQQKLKSHEEAWRCSEQHALEIQAELEANQLKMKELTSQMEEKLTLSDQMLHKLKTENNNLLKDVTRLSSERIKLLSFIEGLGDKICEFSGADMQLMGTLKRIEMSFEHNDSGMNLKEDNGFFVKENVNLLSPNGVKKLEAISDTRPPFRELNN